MMKKGVIKSILITVAVLLILLIISITIFLFCFTNKFADMMYDLGWFKMSINTYILDYNNHNNLDSIKNACDISIKTQDYHNYLISYELFSSNNNYNEYINKLNNANKDNQSLPLLLKSSLINEDNYYKNKNILSLIKTNNLTQTKTQIIDNVNDINNKIINYHSPSIYLLNTYLDNTNDYLFFTQNSINEKTLLECVFEYYNKLDIEYNSQLSNQVDDLYFLAFCRHFIIVSEDILIICNNTNQDVVLQEDIDNINNKIMDIDSTIKDIVGK